MIKLSAVVICVLIELAMTVQPSFAQDNAPEFGVKGGLNFANFSWDIPEGSFETVSAIKFGVGGIMLYSLSELLDVQIELMYLQKGAKFEETKWNFAYLSIPVLGRYKFGSENASTYVVAGPEIGFLLSAKFENSGAVEDIKDVVKSIDLGINVGAGVSMNMDSTPVFWEIRYSVVLSNWIDDPNIEDSAKNRGIQLFVGMMF